MISHASYVGRCDTPRSQTATISALIETMIETTLPALSVTTAGLAPLALPRQPATVCATVPLTAVTGLADEKHRAAFRAPTETQAHRWLSFVTHGEAM